MPTLDATTAEGKASACVERGRHLELVRIGGVPCPSTHKSQNRIVLKVHIAVGAHLVLGRCAPMLRHRLCRRKALPAGTSRTVMSGAALVGVESAGAVENTMAYQASGVETGRQVLRDGDGGPKFLVAREAEVHAGMQLEVG